MMRKAGALKKIATVLMTGTMMAALAVPVLAADREPAETVQVKNVTITKEIDKYVNSYAPNTSFQFQVVPGSGSEDGKIYAGVANGVGFASGKDRITFSPAAGDIGADKVTGTTQLSVNEAAFEKPGIYRYVVSEVIPANGYDGVQYSTEKKIFDVYKYSDGSFAYCFENEDQEKDNGKFTNIYQHGGENRVNDLTVKKIITGNLGNKSQKFTFKLKVVPSDSGEQFYVKSSTGTVLKTQWDGSEMTIQLGDQESATIYGLSAKDTYTVTEVAANQDGYTTKINNDSTKDGVNSGNIKADTGVTYENYKNTEIPTGIAMDVAPYAIMVVMAIVLGAVFFHTRRLGKNK